MNFYLQLSIDWRFIMRITLSQLIIILILTGISYAAPSKAQGVLNNTVSLGNVTTTLQNALEKIEKVAEVKFVYSKDIVDMEQQVSIPASTLKLSELLDGLLISRGFRYELVSGQIVLSKTNSASETIESKEIAVTGKVTDVKGDPLIGVSVKVKGGTQGAATDINGNFSLRLRDDQGEATLVFTYLGYLTKEVPLKGQRVITVQLAENIKALDEVVVVGYNIVKKSDVTGAVVSVGAEEIRSRPVQNTLQAIQGKAAGVDVTSNERPGEMGRILIRGVRSLRASNDPLYVVDGIPLSAGGIEAVNPNDIETIDILKDASATAVYGSRGANGVVLITTKRGKNGAASLNYVGTTTVENMSDHTEMMNSAQYVEFRRDAYRRITYLNQFLPANQQMAGGYPDGAPTLAADANIFKNDTYAFANIQQGYQNGAWDGSLVPTTDWTSMTLKRGITQDHILSASGGTDKLKAYGSFGYLNQGGTQLGQDYERFSGKFSVDLNPVKWFAFGGSVTSTFGNQNFGFSTSNATGPGNLYFAAQGMLPYAVPFDASGKRINLPGGDINILNPIGEENYNINERKVIRTLGSLYAEANILKNLKYRVNFGPDFYNWKNGRWMDENSINRGGGEPGSSNYAQLDQVSRMAWTLDNLLYYNTTFARKHSVNLTLLQSSTSNREERSLMRAVRLPWDSQKWYQLNSVSALDAFSSNLVESSLTSYMARANYDFNSKYILTASARWDGASQLAEGNKWDFFPSASLAWRLEQEPFLKSVPWISQLKLRAGVGSTGNSAVDPYTTEGRLETLYYTWGSTIQPGYVSSDASLANPVPMPNKELGWEHTTQWNVGTDFDFFRGRISGSLDFYTSRTKDLLMLMSIPSVTGYTTTLANVGRTGNKGIDFTLNTINIAKRNLNWSTTLNFSANRDRIVELASGKQDDISNGWFIGERLTSYYDYVKQGIWQDTPEDRELMEKFNANIPQLASKFRPGSIKVADLNGDYKIDANNDRQIVGHANPNWTAGISNTLNYRNWDFTVFIFGRFGYSILAGSEALQGRFAQRVVNYWTPTNPTNDYPAPYWNSASGDPYRSSMNYQEASFIKIRNLSIGYNLPKNLSNRLRMSNLKIYGQVLNPGLLYSKIDWIDPDLGGSTFNRGFVLGLNVGF